MVLGVSVDDDPEAYSKFIIDQHVSFATYRAVSKQIAAEYGTSMFPDTYIIDRRGRIARKVMGPQKWDSPEMLAYFDSLLAQN
jgi:peroxiredoxin